MKENEIIMNQNDSVLIGPLKYSIPHNFIFQVGKTKIEICDEGFKYNGELIKDSQEIYDLFKKFLNEMKYTNTP